MKKRGLSADTKNMRGDNPYKTALTKSMKLCATREYCRIDMLRKLHKWNITSEEENNNILSALTEDKFIDESRYASFFARDKMRYNKWGKVKIKHHLRQKEIDDEYIDRALREIDEEEYISIANRIIVSMIKAAKGKDVKVVREKILRSMQAKGFEYPLSDALLRELDKHRGDNKP